MKLILDTHALVWATVEPSRLSARVRDMISDPENVCLISAVSAYEILYKRDREPILQRLPEDLEQALTTSDFSWLSITAAHATAAARLPRHHRDPWDRILLAQAVAEDSVLLTADTRMKAYDAQIVW